MKDALVRFGVAMEGSLLEEFDALVAEQGGTRSELLRRGGSARGQDEDQGKAVRHWQRRARQRPPRVRGGSLSDRRPFSRRGRLPRACERHHSVDRRYTL